MPCRGRLAEGLSPFSPSAMADPKPARKGTKVILALVVVAFVLLAVAIVGSCHKTGQSSDVIAPPPAARSIENP